MSDTSICGLCGGPMPKGQEMFQYHTHGDDCEKHRALLGVASAGGATSAHDFANPGGRTVSVSDDAAKERDDLLAACRDAGYLGTDVRTTIRAIQAKREVAANLHTAAMWIRRLGAHVGDDKQITQRALAFADEVDPRQLGPHEHRLIRSEES